MKNKNIDLSVIKDDEIDKTSSFTDLMSRSERRKHKEKSVEENKDVFNIEEEVSETKNDSQKPTKVKKNIDKSKKKLDVEDIINEEINIVENNSQNNDKGFLLIIIFLLGILSLGGFIATLFLDSYSINKIIVSGFILVIIIFLMGLIFSTRKLRAWLSVLYFIFICGYIIYNVLILTGYYQELINLLK